MYFGISLIEKKLKKKQKNKKHKTKNKTYLEIAMYLWSYFNKCCGYYNCFTWVKQ